jgi:glycerophosphoryl diester phosphodiesterase
MSTVSAVKRVGHKGADLIAPGNTRASFDAALAAGVDMIEFDVLRDPADGRLVLAHDYHDLATRRPLTLQEGLEHLASSSFSATEFDVDLKLPGNELEVVEALADHGMLGRSLISSQFTESLARVRAVQDDVRLGWSVPRLRRDPFRNRLMRGPAWAALITWREVLPLQAARVIRAGQCDALMAHWRLITPRLVRHVRGAGGELYAWTVDEPARIRALEALGVTGVITNDPRLFKGVGTEASIVD